MFVAVHSVNYAAGVVAHHAEAVAAAVAGAIIDKKLIQDASFSLNNSG